MRKTMLYSAVCVTMLLCVCVQVFGVAQEITVPNGGDLAGAVGRAEPGTVVRLAEGSFTLTTTMKIDKPIALEGITPGKTIVYTSAEGAGVRFEGNGPWRVVGISFVHIGRSTADVIQVAGGPITMVGCSCSGGISDKAVAARNPADGGGHGIVLNGRSTHIISQSQFSSNEGIGICANEQAVAIVEGSRCVRNGAAGLVYRQQSSGKAIDNDCSENGQMGIYLSTSGGVDVEENRCFYNGSIGICVGTSATGSVRKNRCSGAEQGIQVKDTARPVVEANTCTNNKWGILLTGKCDPQLKNNTCNANSEADVRDQR